MRTRLGAAARTDGLHVHAIPIRRGPSRSTERRTRVPTSRTRRPLILVESPLPFEQVSSPLRVTGTANTFEATFQYELLDSEGNVVDKNFVTATSGTGTRGTFDFTTGDVSDAAKLVVYENSAENGSRVNEVEIPLDRRLVGRTGVLSRRGRRSLALLAMRHGQRAGRERLPDVRALAEPVRPRAGNDRCRRAGCGRRRSLRGAVGRRGGGDRAGGLRGRSGALVKRGRHAAGVRGEAGGVRGTEAALAPARVASSSRSPSWSISSSGQRSAATSARTAPRPTRSLASRRGRWGSRSRGVRRAGSARRQPPRRRR